MLIAKVSDKQVMVKYGPNGIPAVVRNQLRALIPDITRRLAREVNANLNTGLKSRRRLKVNSEMVENPQGIFGRVTTVATDEPFMLPQWLEDGTRPHKIAARNVSALFFFWERFGKNVMFRSVNHPGFAGIHYTEVAFASMRDEIQADINRVVRDAVGGRR